MNQSGPSSLVDVALNGESFPVPEDHLTAVLGIPRRTLREARATSTRGVDWELAGKRIFWSQGAADRFVCHLAPENGGAPRQEAAQIEVDPVDLPQVLRVVAWNFPNRRVIHCMPENGNTTSERVAVRVKDARLFRNGMRVLARPAVGSAWQFEGNPDNAAAGPRGPRWPGKW
jgi:hypothetical protein